MKYTIVIDCDNAAFWNDEDHEPGYELALILRKIADKQGAEGWSGRIMDSNGNTVGKAEVSE